MHGREVSRSPFMAGSTASRTACCGTSACASRARRTLHPAMPRAAEFIDYGDPRMPGSLDGKVALITGAARRNGRAMAHTLAADGAAVVINTRRSVEEAQQVRADIEAKGGRALVCVADITD